MRGLVAILSLVTTLTSAAAMPDAQPARDAEEIGVTGVVAAPDGTPVSEGSVVTDSGRITASIDRTGRFRLIPTRSGLFQILVRVPGLAPYRLTVTVPVSRSVRLPVIHLAPGAYFRARLVSPAGEPIAAPQLRRRSFDFNGNPIADGIDEHRFGSAAADGAIAIGPLPRGMITLAVDNPFFAQTRLPDLTFEGGAKDVDGGTIVIQQPGAVLHVDLVDEAGAAVRNHYVYLEDVLPRSPLTFRPVQTNQQGRATFDRLGPGRYRVSTAAVDRCEHQVFLTAARVVPMSGRGSVETRLVVGGGATFRISSPLGSLKNVAITAAPDALPTPSPSRFPVRAVPSGCAGTTDADGRVTLTNFPPGPAQVAIRMGNSTYVRHVEVLSAAQDIAVVVPDGFLPVRAVNKLKNQPVAGASVTWTGTGARVEATTSATGEALLEGVGTAAGTLAASARAYDPAEEQLAEPPSFLHDIALTPVATARSLRVQVISAYGDRSE